MFLTREGGGRQQGFKQVAPNEIKLGEGGEKWEELVISLALASGGRTDTGKED